MAIFQPVPMITDRRTGGDISRGLAQYVARNFAALSIFLAAHIGTSWLYLRRAGAMTEPGVPLDDAWIHFVFARNLATHGQLAFNLGQHSAGTTSLLWVFLLAIGYRAIGNMIVMAWIYGVGASLLATIGVFELARELFAGHGWTDRGALLIALGYASSGVIVWHRLSGMEATLFLALGLLTIVAYQKRHLTVTSLLLALLILTRIEGVVLLVIIAAFEVASHRYHLPSLGRSLFSLAAFPIILSIPVLVFTYQTTGNLLPTTFAGRRWLIGLQRPLWSVDPVKSFLEFLARWVYYIYAYLFMGIRASSLPFTVALSGFGRTRPVNLLYLGLVAGLIVTGGIFFVRTLIQRRAWHPRSLSGLGLFVIWVALHNLTYLLFLPWIGHAGRYQMMNFAVVWLLIGASLAGLREVAPVRDKEWPQRARVLLGVCFVIFVLLNTLSLQVWAGYYVHGVQRINSLHVQVARWINRHLSDDTRLAAFDIGAIGYFAQQEVVDLSGLTSEDYLDYLYADRITEYLAQEGVTHVVLTNFLPPGVGGFNDILNIYRNQGEAYRLVRLQSYHVTYTDDLLATSNASSSIEIFQIQWSDAYSSRTSAQ